MQNILEVLQDTAIDTLKLLPFLFITYLIMEYIEHKTSNKIRETIKKSGRFGPLFGAVVGIFPQCGFSVSATNLYAARVISLGTLISVYLATSDEMLPILLTESVPIATILTILGIKLFLGIVAGFIIDFVANVIKKEEEEKIEEICEQIRVEGKFVVPANYNCSSQIAISGASDAIELAIEKLKKAGAKRVIKLKTSGPFHTEKLQDASELFETELKKINFQTGNNVKIIKNIDGKFYSENDNFKEILAKHIVSPVRFDKAIQLMKAEGIKRFIEIGPGKTLTGFIKKDYPEAELYNINNLETLEKIGEK